MHLFDTFYFFSCLSFLGANAAIVREILGSKVVLFTISLYASGINLEEPLYIRPTYTGKLPSLSPRVAVRESETLYIRPTYQENYQV